MARYYFCNGTTKKNRPCQNPVPMEGDKCAYHRDGGGGPGPSIFSLLKTGVEGMVWLHAAHGATMFTIEVGKRLIEIIGAHLNIHVDGIEDLASALEANEREVTRRINSLSEDRIREIVAISNLIVALSDEEEDDSSTEELTAYA